MNQHKAPPAAPGPNERGSVLSIRMPVEMLERLDRARYQFSDPGAEPLSISELARRLLESGAQHPRLEHLAEIALLREQPTKALLRMRRKWEDDQEFSRSEWELLARYAEKDASSMAFHLTQSCRSVNRLRKSSKRSWRYGHCGVAPTRSSTGFTVAIVRRQLEQSANDS